MTNKKNITGSFMKWIQSDNFYIYSKSKDAGEIKKSIKEGMLGFNIPEYCVVCQTREAQIVSGRFVEDPLCPFPESCPPGLLHSMLESFFRNDEGVKCPIAISRL